MSGFDGISGYVFSTKDHEKELEQNKITVERLNISSQIINQLQVITISQK